MRSSQRDVTCPRFGRNLSIRVTNEMTRHFVTQRDVTVCPSVLVRIRTHLVRTSVAKVDIDKSI